MSHRALLALLAILAVARCDCSERGRPGGDPDPDNAGDGGGGPGPDAGGPAPLDGGQADGGGDDASGNDDGGGDDAGDAGDDDDGGQEDPDGGQVDGGGPEADAGGGPLPGHVNSAPEIWSQPVTTARVGRPYRYAVLADDVDGDPLRFSLGAGPEGMTLDASGGLLAWVPPPGSAGSVQVTVEVQDPGGAGDAQPFTSRPPLAAAPGADYRYEARAEDPDDAALAWSVTGPDGLAVSADGVVTWSVPADDAGAFPVELTARDAAGHEDVQAWAIGVARPGDRQPPTVRIDSPAAGARLETPVDVTGTATDEALAGYRLEACKTWGDGACRLLGEGLQPVEGGVLGRLDPRTLVEGTWEIRLVASDAAGNEARASTEVLLDPVAPAGALRLGFTDLIVQQGGVEVALRRIYDGLDLSEGELGPGWRYEWSIGHSEVPEPLNIGWELRQVHGFPPSFEVDPAVDHPLRFVLPDGRVYLFMALLEHAPSLESVHSVRPAFEELSGTGASLWVLDRGFNPLARHGWPLYFFQDELFEDILFEREWEPAYFELTTDWGEVFVFEAATGRVVRRRDDSGLELDFASGTEVELDGRDLIRFERQDGRVTAAEDAVTGARVEYERDERGDLVQVRTTDDELQTFEYAEGHRLVAWDAPGLGAEAFEHDENGRVVRHTDPEGVVTETEYDDENRRVTVRDAAGNAIVTETDEEGRVVRITDPLGNETSYTYAPGTSRVATKTDALGNTWAFEYDEKGRRTVVENPLGERTELVYRDGHSLPLAVTDGEGRRFEEVLDAEGRVGSWVLPDGQVVRSFSYGDLTVTETDTAGRQATSRFDERGRLVSYTDFSGRTTSGRYDDEAHTLTVTAPDGSVQVGELDTQGRFTRADLGEAGAFEYEWGAGELPDRVVRPDGVEVEYRKSPGGQLQAIVADGEVVQDVRRDALGRVASIRTPTGARTFRYDAAGQVTEVTFQGHAVRYERDALGRVVGVEDDSGRAQSLVRDAVGRIVGLEDADGRRVEVTWDRSDRVTRVVDALGGVTEAAYDATGRLSGVTWPGGLSASWTYLPSPDVTAGAPRASFTGLDGVRFEFERSGDDELLAVTDPLGGTTRYEYAAEAVTAIVDAAGGRTELEWGEAGLARVTDPEGRAQVFAHDAAGRPSSWTRPDGSVVRYEYEDGLVRTVLPSGGRHELRRDPGTRTVEDSGAAGGTVREWLDASGNTLRLELDDGAAVDASWTGDGKLLALTVTGPGGDPQEVTYGRDSTGRVVLVTGPDGGETQYERDARGRVTRVVRVNGVETTLAWGEGPLPVSVRHEAADGEVREHRWEHDARGRLTARVTPAGRVEYEHDALGRLVAARGPDDEVTWEYDALGNVPAVTDAAGRRTREYDRAGRLLREEGPAGERTWTWSGRGALLAAEGPGGTTRYEYDDLDHLTAVELPDGRRVEYAYDGRGHLLARTADGRTRRCLPLPGVAGGHSGCVLSWEEGGDGAVEVRVFGPLGPEALHGPDGTRHLLLGHNGAVVGSTDAAGALDGAWEYDPWGVRVAAQGGPVPYGYAGERQDSDTGLVFLRARWYDPTTGRFLTPDRAEVAAEDPRTLHRYLYGLADPLHRLDPTGEFTIIGALTTMNIRSTLRRMRAVAYHCAKKTAVRRTLAQLTVWSAKAMKSLLPDNLDSFLKSFAKDNFVGLREKELSMQLWDLLCGSEEAKSDGFWEFEVRIDDCGNRKPRSNNPLGALVDCLAEKMKVNNGIDMVFGGIVPVELKIAKGTYKDKQLVRYCRFGARQGSLSSIYLFVFFPNEKKEGKGKFVFFDKAKMCWNCWNTKKVKLDSCPDAPGHGAIWVAFGIVKNKAGKFTYVPDKNVCKMM